MGNATKKLGELLDYLDSENLLLPEIQRDFVWDKKNILMLFDSLYRELPIGNVLVWKARHRVGSKKLRASIHRIGKRIDSFYGYLLDGQQRLTAVKLVRDDPDDYSLMFNILTEVDNEEPFTWKARWNESSPWYVAVSRVLENGFHPMDVLDVLKEEEDYDQSKHRVAIDRALRRLQDILRYDIGVIEYDEDNYQKAMELFIRFNSTGKKLSKPELALAQLALAAPKLVTEGIGDLQERIPGFSFTKSFLLQCLVSIHTTRMKMAQPQRIWDNSDERSIRLSWKKAEKGVERIVEFLTGIIQWDATSWVPSMVTLVPLIYVFGLGNKPSVEERHLAKKWLLLANVRSVFAGSGYHKFETLFHFLKNDPTVDTLWKYTHRDFHSNKIKPEDFDTKRKSGSIMSLYIAMLRGRHAEDWKRGTPLNGRVVGENAELQVHHFFPQALLREHEFNNDSINTFANYTVISKNTNLECRAEEPAKYIKRLKIEKKHLKAQYIPMDRNLWKVENYENFLAERRRLLARQANMFLG